MAVPSDVCIHDFFVGIADGCERLISALEFCCREKRSSLDEANLSNSLEKVLEKFSEFNERLVVVDATVELLLYDDPYIAETSTLLILKMQLLAASYIEMCDIHFLIKCNDLVFVIHFSERERGFVASLLHISNEVKYHRQPSEEHLYDLIYWILSQGVSKFTPNPQAVSLAVVARLQNVAGANDDLEYEHVLEQLSSRLEADVRLWRKEEKFLTLSRLRGDIGAIHGDRVLQQKEVTKSFILSNPWDKMDGPPSETISAVPEGSGRQFLREKGMSESVSSPSGCKELQYDSRTSATKITDVAGSSIKQEINRSSFMPIIGIAKKEFGAETSAGLDSDGDRPNLDDTTAGLALEDYGTVGYDVSYSLSHQEDGVDRSIHEAYVTPSHHSDASELLLESPYVHSSTLTIAMCDEPLMVTSVDVSALRQRQHSQTMLRFDGVESPRLHDWKSNINAMPPDDVEGLRDSLLHEVLRSQKEEDIAAYCRRAYQAIRNNVFAHRDWSGDAELGKSVALSSDRRSLILRSHQPYPHVSTPLIAAAAARSPHEDKSEVEGECKETNHEIADDPADRSVISDLAKDISSEDIRFRRISPSHEDTTCFSFVNELLERIEYVDENVLDRRISEVEDYAQIGEEPSSSVDMKPNSFPSEDYAVASRAQQPSIFTQARREDYGASSPYIAALDTTQERGDRSATIMIDPSLRGSIFGSLDDVYAAANIDAYNYDINYRDNDDDYQGKSDCDLTFVRETAGALNATDDGEEGDDWLLEDSSADISRTSPFSSLPVKLPSNPVAISSHEDSVEMLRSVEVFQQACSHNPISKSVTLVGTVVEFGDDDLEMIPGGKEEEKAMSNTVQSVVREAPLEFFPSSSKDSAFSVDHSHGVIDAVRAAAENLSSTADLRPYADVMSTYSQKENYLEPHAHVFLKESFGAAREKIENRQYAKQVVKNQSRVTIGRKILELFHLEMQAKKKPTESVSLVGPSLPPAPLSSLERSLSRSLSQEPPPTAAVADVRTGYDYYGHKLNSAAGTRVVERQPVFHPPLVPFADPAHESSHYFTSYHQHHVSRDEPTHAVVRVQSNTYASKIAHNPTDISITTTTTPDFPPLQTLERERIPRPPHALQQRMLQHRRHEEVAGNSEGLFIPSQPRSTSAGRVGQAIVTAGPSSSRPRSASSGRGAQTSLSNYQQVKNALSNVCLAGPHQQVDRNEALLVMDRYRKTSGGSGPVPSSPSRVVAQAHVRVLEASVSHFVILLYHSKNLSFRGLYGHVSNVLHKLFGRGPRSLPESLVEEYLKYESSSRSFISLPTKSLTSTADAVAVDPAKLTKYLKSIGSIVKGDDEK